jgi:hypothetical protein
MPASGSYDAKAVKSPLGPQPSRVALRSAAASGTIALRNFALRRRSYANTKGNGLTMEATSMVVIYIVVGGIVSVIGMVISVFLFSFLVLPRVVKQARGGHFRLWTPWFFASLTFVEPGDAEATPSHSARKLSGRDH